MDTGRTNGCHHTLSFSSEDRQCTVLDCIYDDLYFYPLNRGYQIKYALDDDDLNIRELAGLDTSAWSTIITSHLNIS